MNGLMRRHAGLKCFGWQKETRRPASTAGDGLTLRFRQIAQFLLAAVFTASHAAALADEQSTNAVQADRSGTVSGIAELESTVGMMRRITQIYFEGPELTLKTMESQNDSVVIRIDAVYPHGSGFRYDLTWSADLPGEFNLLDSLRRSDGSDVTNLPPLKVTVRSVLAPDRLIPNPVQAPPARWVGGYYAVARLFWILWWSGLATMIFFWVRKRSQCEVTERPAAEQRLDDIRKLIEQALQGEQFSAEDRSRIERLTVAFWVDQKQLHDQSPRQVFHLLQEDPDAGPLLAELERWLYDRPSADQRYITELLEPMNRLLAAAEETEKVQGEAS